MLRTYFILLDVRDYKVQEKKEMRQAQDGEKFLIIERQLEQVNKLIELEESLYPEAIMEWKRNWYGDAE